MEIFKTSTPNLGGGLGVEGIHYCNKIYQIYWSNKCGEVGIV